MGMSGEEYDRQYPDYTPNKDRRMAEWRAKKAKEREEQDRQGAADAAREERRRYGTDAERREDEATAKEKETPSAPAKSPSRRKPRRKAFDQIPDEEGPVQLPLPFE